MSSLTSSPNLMLVAGWMDGERERERVMEKEEERRKGGGKEEEGGKEEGWRGWKGGKVERWKDGKMERTKALELGREAGPKSKWQSDASK